MLPPSRCLPRSGQLCSTLLPVLIALSIGCRKESSATESRQPVDGEVEEVAETGRSAASWTVIHQRERLHDEAVDRTTTYDKDTVLLITVDGARWQDVFDGADPALIGDEDIGDWAEPDRLLPNIRALMREGVALGGEPGCGVVRPAGTSNVSLPGYLEILSGHTTSCSSNTCMLARSGGNRRPSTILDDAVDAGLSVASVSSWEPLALAVTSKPSSPFRSAEAPVDIAPSVLLEHAAPAPSGEPMTVGRPFVVSAGTEQWVGMQPHAGSVLEALVLHGSRSGPEPSPAPQGHYRPDTFTSAVAIELLRTIHPRFMHIGLGDADELAHRGDYIGYLTALHAADALIGDATATVAPTVNPLRPGDRSNPASNSSVTDLARSGGLTILVVADHGRAGASFRDHGVMYADSGRSFVLAFGRDIPRRGRTCLKHDVRLVDVGATIRSLLNLPPASASSGSAGHPIDEIVEGRAGPSLR